MERAWVYVKHVFLKSVIIWGAVTSAGVVPLWLSSPKSMQPSIRRFWSTLCFHLLRGFMEMLISFSSRTWNLLTNIHIFSDAPVKCIYIHDRC